MKILFLTNVPSPYRVDFFNELGKYCELTVTFEKHTSDERKGAWTDYHFVNFKGVFLRGKSINTDSAICFDVLKHVKDRSYDRIICMDFTTPTGMIAVQYMKNHGIKYWLESDGGFPKDGKGIKERIKKHFISGADGYFSTGAEHDKYYLAYGAEPDRIHRYPFTSLYERDIIKEIPSKEEKRRYRSRLGIIEECVILSVGRFSYLGGYGKGFDILVKSAHQIPDVGIYIVGDDPTDEFLKMRKDYNAHNVHFISHKSKAELQEYYRAADTFVLLTRGDVWGLVINEAMANGLPVVTSNKCGAGLALINHGVNGFVIEDNYEKKFLSVINTFILDEKKQITLSKETLKMINMYTIEEMVHKHICKLKGNT